jgi:alpha-glucosidase (family GH31 glycosyl hydrolase)
MTLFEQLCYENMVSKWGVSNYYTFARSAVDRSRSRTYIWNGDSHSDFEGLAYTVASGIRAGILGFSQWASDTGGYVRGPEDPSEELWARWMHFSTFTPSYEIMVGTNHTPWYPPYTSRIVSVLKETAQLHTELIPYIKSYTYKATQTGIPVIRALFLEYPDDKKVYQTTDTYAFGSEFLVAPIVNAGGERDVYFPTGSSYLEYFNKTQVFAGGSTHRVNLEWEYAPVYVREGSVIPKGDIYQGNHKWDTWTPWLEIEVFPSYGAQDSKFEYYDGKRNRTSEITLETNKKKDSVRITYDDLGLPGKLVVFGKGRNHTYNLEEGGGDVTIDGFESLFG